MSSRIKRHPVREVDQDYLRRLLLSESDCAPPCSRCVAERSEPSGREPHDSTAPSSCVDHEVYESQQSEPSPQQELEQQLPEQQLSEPQLLQDDELEEAEEEEEEVEAAALINATWPMTGTSPRIAPMLRLLIAGSAGRVSQITDAEGDRRRWLEEATGAADALRLLARSSARKSMSLRAALWRAAQTQSRTIRDASRFRSA